MKPSRFVAVLKSSLGPLFISKASQIFARRICLFLASHRGLEPLFNSILCPKCAFHLAKLKILTKSRTIIIIIGHMLTLSRTIQFGFDVKNQPRTIRLNIMRVEGTRTTSKPTEGQAPTRMRAPCRSNSRPRALVSVGAGGYFFVVATTKKHHLVQRRADHHHKQTSHPACFWCVRLALRRN